MSRAITSGIWSYTGFPRVSGDEPFSKNATTRDTAFSPRERG